MRTTWNDNNDKTGAEGWYEIRDNALIFYIEPTSGKMWPPSTDWKTNFVAIPTRITTGSKVKCHRGYLPLAYWIDGFITQLLLDGHGVKNLVIAGYSMGGGIAKIVGYLMANKIETCVIDIDGPRTMSIEQTYVKTYYKRGSFLTWLPPWFVAVKNKICVDKNYQPMWKSHYWSSAEIEAILETAI